MSQTEMICGASVIVRLSFARPPSLSADENALARTSMACVHIVFELFRCGAMATATTTDATQESGRQRQRVDDDETQTFQN